MGGITMWIILGSLVGVVAIFLVVASVLDRKKMKKVKAERAVLNKMQQGARANIAIWVNLVVEQNAKLMKEFVPSVGLLKMSDIRDRAKKALELLERKKEYKIASEAKENADVIAYFKQFKETNSNIWESKLAAPIAFFAKEEKQGLEIRKSTTAPKTKDKTNVKTKTKKPVKVVATDNTDIVESSKVFKEEAIKMIKGVYK